MTEEIQKQKLVENIRDKLLAQISKLIQEAESELQAINLKKEKGNESDK